MKNIAFVIYRNWAFDIFAAIDEQLSDSDNIAIPLLITTKECEFLVPSSVKYKVLIIDGNDQEALEQILTEYKIHTVCFYGWSWIVKEPILSKYVCLCLHPSPLPKYRGGSPIQHQLIAGETVSAVSIFRMGVGIDDGPIFTQIPISFEGYLQDIFLNIIQAGISGTKQYVSDLVNLEEPKFVRQLDIDNYPPLKRRRVSDSGISLEDAKGKNYLDFFNLVRGLQPPYPTVFIKLKLGILHILKIEYSDKCPKSSFILNLDCEINNETDYALELSDGYAILKKFNFSKEAGT